MGACFISLMLSWLLADLVVDDGQNECVEHHAEKVQVHVVCCYYASVPMCQCIFSFAQLVG